jgi:hypothetical protein
VKFLLAIFLTQRTSEEQAVTLEFIATYERGAGEGESVKLWAGEARYFKVALRSAN